MVVIKWCNENQGFLTALLSLLGLFISFWAVVVSIQTARLPYRKRVLLNGNLVDIRNLFSKEIHDLDGVNVNIVNVGNRAINFTFVGLAIRDKSNKMKELHLLDWKPESFILEQSKTHSVYYKIKELEVYLCGEKPSQFLYAYAVDTERKTYKKYICKIGQVTKHFNKRRNS